MLDKIKKPEFHMPENLDRNAPHVWLASWFGFGFLSPAPGTWGSLGALPFGLALYVFGGTAALLWGVVIITTIGLWAAQRFDEDMADHDEDGKGHDSKMIVIDEAAGMWIALIPAGLNPLLILLAFIAFRGFDILKPWPVRVFDRNIAGSAGVMGDDLVAGIMAALVVWALGWLMLY